MALAKRVVDALVKLVNRLRHCDGGRGAVRFLIRNWRGVDDVNLLAEILAAETWRTIIRPAALAYESIGRLMAIAPHQDDEVIGAGGLLLKAAAAGTELTLLYATDGAQTGIRLDGRKLTPEEVARLRRSEARAVCERLGARMAELGIDNHSMAITPQHVGQLARMLDDLRPEVVAVPWLFDGAPKHRAINQLLYHALQQARHRPPQIWGYQVNNTPVANAWLDISDIIDEKIALVEIYRSQNETLRDYAHVARGMAAWNSRFLPSKQYGGRQAYAEVFTTLACEDFMHLVHRYLLRDMARTYCGRMPLARNMERLRAQLERSANRHD